MLSAFQNDIPLWIFHLNDRLPKHFLAVNAHQAVFDHDLSGIFGRPIIRHAFHYEPTFWADFKNDAYSCRFR